MKFLNSLALKGYYHGGLFGKSIQPSYKFTVEIYDNSIFKKATDPIGRELYNRIGPMPIIAPWSVLNISVPQYDFKKEVQYYGPVPKSFPYLEYDGMEFTIEFEEDTYGTIGYFIAWLQKRIVSKDGLYTPPAYVPLDRIMVQTEDEFGLPVLMLTFHRCYYLNSSSVTYDYSSNESVKYNVTFNSDYMSVFYPKKAPSTAAQYGIGSAINAVGDAVKNLKSATSKLKPGMLKNPNII